MISSRFCHRTASLVVSASLVSGLVGVPKYAWSGPASKPPDMEQPRAARELKKKGDDAMDAHQYADADSAYAEAYAISSDPALLYNRGRSLQAQGKYPEALEQLERFAKEASPELRAKVPLLDQLITELQGRVTTLNLHCNVEGARIVVRNQVLGLTPLAAVRLRAGKASVEISAEGYTPFQREVDLPGAGSLTLEVNLVRKDQSGILAIQTSIAGAAVFVDDNPIGNAPVEISVSAGAHHIVIRHPGYLETKTSAVLGVGERKQVSISLEKSAPITSKWWFWTGIGVLVVGGVATTAALLSEKKAKPGDITPGQIAAPLMRF